MQHDARSTPRDAQFEAARRFSERAKASAQWRRSAHPGAAQRPPGVRAASSGKRGENRSHA